MIYTYILMTALVILFITLLVLNAYTEELKNKLKDYEKDYNKFMYKVKTLFNIDKYTLEHTIDELEKKRKEEQDLLDKIILSEIKFKKLYYKELDISIKQRRLKEKYWNEKQELKNNK